MSQEYNRYLKQHRDNVAKSFQWLKRNLPEIFIFEDDDRPLWGIEYDMAELENQICIMHDISKTYDDEYIAYDNYFYGNNKSYEVVKAFEKAWLLHVHRNPHHWQHWILHDSDIIERYSIFEMPRNYVIEMICDWWSFSWKDGNLFSIFDWYEQNKDKMILDFKTKELVESILEKMKNKLEEQNNS